MTSAQRPPGRVITFYSYKGGTGRSMALANMAWLLAMAGRKVVVLDWDLEAPGLHRYFSPFLSDPDLTASNGLIDFMYGYMEDASAATADERTEPERVSIGSLTIPVDYEFRNGGVLDFIPAGRQTEAYAERVNYFDWKYFYKKLGGWAVIDVMRDQLREEYEFVLIDSRTGVSDTAGICTVQIPDDVVVCFTLNYQSVDGASSAAKSMRDQSAARGRQVGVFPVPMRVESGEKFKREAVAAHVYTRFGPFLDEKRFGPFTPDYGAPGATTRRQYIDDVTVPHIQFYAFEELIAWFLDAPTEVGSVLASIKRLTGYVVDPSVTRDLPGPGAAEREDVLKRFGGVWSTTAPAGATRPLESVPAAVARPLRQGLYFSAPSAGDEAAQAIELQLRTLSMPLRTSGHGDPQSGRPDAIWNALGECRAAVFLIGPHGPGRLQARELALILEWRRQEERAGRDFRLVPVLLPGAAAAAPGLVAFGELDAPMFFGRDLIVDALLGRINAARIVVLFGERGSGKTSLVAAGLVPALRRIRSADTAWEINWQSMDGLSDSQALDAFVRASAPALEAAATNQLFVADDVPPLVLPSLIAAVEKAVADQQRYFVFVVNGEQPTAPVRAGASLTVPLPSREERRRMIESPAAAAGLAVEPELVDRILDASEGIPVAILSLALAEMWTRRNSHLLTNAQWDDIGPLDTLIERWADAAFDRIPATLHTAASSLLVRLFRTAGNAVVRTPLAWRTMDDAERDIAARLTDVGLVTLDLAVAGQEPAARLTHMLLAVHWPRLRQWRESNLELLAWRERITPLIKQWQPRKEAAYLLTGLELREAQRWSQERPTELTAAERDYISESERAERETESKGAAALVRQRRGRQYFAAFAILAGLLVLGGNAFRQRTQTRQNAVLQAATQQLQGGNPTAAIMAFRDAGSLLEDDPRALALMGEARLALDDPAGAATNFRSAIRLNPADPAAYKGLARALKLQGDMTGAIEQYDRILGAPGQQGVAPGDEQTLRDRAFARRMQGDVAGAMDDYEEVLKRAPDDVQSRSDLTALIREVKATRPTDANGLAVRGRANLLDGDAAAAAKDFEQAIELEPTKVFLLKGLAYAYKLQGDMPRALQIYNRIVDARGLAPDDVQTLKDRAFARRTQSDWDGAIADYEAALQRDGGDEQTRKDLAYARVARSVK